ncbi:MAG: M20 family metallopeptidase [Promethearchaeota archaeon]
MEHQKIIEFIDEHKEEYIKFLQKLVQTPSYNPPGTESKICLLIEKYLKKGNITYEKHPFGDKRANLVAFLNNNPNGKILLYNGHMDTVPPGDNKKWKYPPLSGTIEENKVMYGRGTTDMKSGLAAMIISLKVLKSLKPTLSGNLILNAVAEEETGGFLGTKWCLENVLKDIHCDFVVVGEYTGLNALQKGIIVGEKGDLQIKITINGKSAHASVPFLGYNPINIMSKIIVNLDKIDKYLPEIQLPFPKEEVQNSFKKHLSFPGKFKDLVEKNPLIMNLFKSVTSISKTCTMLNAGIKENMIPDRCEAIIDFRILPNHTVKMVMNALDSMIDNLGFGEFVTLKVHHYTEPSYFEGWKNSKTLTNFFQIVKHIYNIEPIYFLFPASADAEFFRNSNYCNDTILFGPGRFDVAHTTNEFVNLEDFINAIKVYTIFALNFLK